MKWKFLLVFASLVFFISCSGESNQTNKVSEKNGNYSNSSPSSDESTTITNTSVQANVSSQNKTVENQAGKQTESQAEDQVDFLDLIERRKREAAEKAKNAPPANIDPSQMKNATTILPDGSEFWAILDSKGVTETRVFKNHSQLDKIVRFTDERNVNVSIKVYMKDGRVISVPKDKIKDFARDSAEQILMAAGVQKTEPKGTQTGKPSEKKKEG